MAKATLAIAAALLVALTTLVPAPAGAQSPSYESRGYGGPLYVGPNFQGGGQHSTPTYDRKPSSKRYKKKRTYRATKSRKTDTSKKTEQAKASPADESVKSENSSISRAATGGDAPGNDDTATVQNENSSIAAGEISTGSTPKKNASGIEPASASRNVGCKKYFPTAGMTLSVPCD